jgi:hypothetical protein
MLVAFDENKAHDAPLVLNHWPLNAVTFDAMPPQPRVYVNTLPDALVHVMIDGRTDPVVAFVTITTVYSTADALPHVSDTTCGPL